MRSNLFCHLLPRKTLSLFIFTIFHNHFFRKFLSTIENFVANNALSWQKTSEGDSDNEN